MLVLMLCCALAGCERRPPQLTQTAPTPGMRIASLSPAASVILTDMGAGEKLVARHAFDPVSPRGLPVVGDQGGIDFEALVRVQPTHVVTQWGARTLPERLHALAHESRWTLLDLNPITLRDVRESVGLLAPWGEAQQARTLLKQLDAMIEAAEPARTLDQPRPRTLLLLATSPTFAALGPTSCQGEVARAAGLAVVPSDAGPYIELTGEDVLALSPQRVVLLLPRTGGETNAPATRAGIDRATAPLLRLFEGRNPPVVFVVESSDCLLPSTSMLRLFDDLRGWAAPSPATVEPPIGGTP